MNIEETLNKKQGRIFSTNCFIRKNTPELVKALENIGRTKFPMFDESNPWIICYADSFCDFCEDEVDYHETLFGYGIDCGTDEKLFLTLAAQKYDSK